MSELKPCPFCGSTNIRAHVYGGGEPDAFMQCHDCSADGPNGLNREGAIEAWNRRTQPAQVATLTKIEALRIGAMHSEAGAHDRSFTEDGFLAAVRDIEAALLKKMQGDKT